RRGQPLPHPRRHPKRRVLGGRQSLAAQIPWPPLLRLSQFSTQNRKVRAKFFHFKFLKPIFRLPAFASLRLSVKTTFPTSRRCPFLPTAKPSATPSPRSSRATLTSSSWARRSPSSTA